MLLPQASGNVITLCVEKRGVQTNMVYHGNQVALTYQIRWRKWCLISSTD